MELVAAGLNISTRGDREVLAAFDQLPRRADREIKDASERIARELANKIRRNARALGRQDRRPSQTVRTARGRTPQVVAGPHPLLFLSEFGMTRRTGWYSKGRYYDSPARQARPHLGRGSYWFFRTQDAERANVDGQWRAAAEAIVRGFGT